MQLLVSGLWFKPHIGHRENKTSKNDKNRLRFRLWGNFQLLSQVDKNGNYLFSGNTNGDHVWFCDTLKPLWVWRHLGDQSFLIPFNSLHRNIVWGLLPFSHSRHRAKLGLAAVSQLTTANDFILWLALLNPSDWASQLLVYVHWPPNQPPTLR